MKDQKIVLMGYEHIPIQPFSIFLHRFFLNRVLKDYQEHTSDIDWNAVSTYTKTKGKN